MTEQTERLRPNLLIQDDRCMLIGSKVCNPNSPLSNKNYEHLILRKAGKDYPSLFKASPGRSDLTRGRVQVSKWTYEIIDADENLINIHRSCHDIIDNGAAGKSSIYHVFGIPGLILFVGSYPRAVDRNLQDVQYHQWGQLFNEINHNFKVQELRDVEPKLKSEYGLAESLVEMFLFSWSRGNFFEPGSMVSDRGYRKTLQEVQRLSNQKNSDQSSPLVLLSRMR